MKVFVWTCCFVFMISYIGFALHNKELLYFAINTGQWQTGCLADVEGGAFCCVPLLKTLSACPGAKRLLQVDTMGMVLLLGQDKSKEAGKLFPSHNEEPVAGNSFFVCVCWAALQARRKGKAKSVVFRQGHYCGHQGTLWAAGGSLKPSSCRILATPSLFLWVEDGELCSYNRVFKLCP